VPRLTRDLKRWVRHATGAPEEATIVVSELPVQRLAARVRRPAVDAPVPRARQSLLIGLVHGLAGSGSLTALVVANPSSTSARVAYIALFGAGLIASMALMSGVAGWPLVWAYPLVIRFAG
jgi:hypothetical protein